MLLHFACLGGSSSKQAAVGTLFELVSRGSGRLGGFSMPLKGWRSAVVAGGALPSGLVEVEDWLVQLSADSALEVALVW